MTPEREREAVCLLLIGVAGACVLACQWLPVWLCLPAGLLALLLIHPYRRRQEKRIPRNVTRALDGKDPAEVQAASERHR